MSEELKIVEEPYKKIVVHEFIEYRFTDWISMILSNASAAGGTTIPTFQWCSGVVYQITPFNPNSEQVIGEQLKGIIHFAAVTFATKERFEREVRTSEGVIKLVDTGANKNFVKLAAVLNARAQFRT